MFQPIFIMGFFMEDIMEEINYIYDTQMLIAGKNLNEDEINDYITENIEGDCLLAVGDDELIKIHFHTMLSFFPK